MPTIAPSNLQCTLSLDYRVLLTIPARALNLLSRPLARLFIRTLTPLSVSPVHPHRRIVHFAEPADAAEARKRLNGTFLKGRALQVEPAKRRDPAKRNRCVHVCVRGGCTR
jgi:hypothetical protein